MKLNSWILIIIVAAVLFFNKKDSKESFEINKEVEDVIKLLEQVENENGNFKSFTQKLKSRGIDTSALTFKTFTDLVVKKANGKLTNEAIKTLFQ